MPSLAQVFGHKQFRKMVDRRRRRLAGNFVRGIKRAALFLQRKSQKVVPVDTGNLRASAFTVVTGEGFKANAIIGYEAYYGIFVHEDLYARHAKGKQAKFLEDPARIYRAEMAEIIRQEMQKG